MNHSQTLVTYVRNIAELNFLAENHNPQVKIELILGTSLLSRFFDNSEHELIELLRKARQMNFSVTLEWDVLNQEDRFLKTIQLIEKLPMHDFFAIRVQDPGAVSFIKEKYPWLKIHLILENGNHNLIGLKKWSEFLGPQLDRLVLSNELSKELLADYSKALSIPIEILTFGRILLFYSPRKLLSPVEKKAVHDQTIEAFGTSEESPHSGFPLIENLHGTFMFNVKDLYLLDQLQALNEMGIHFLRVDLRFDDSFNKFSKTILELFAGTITEPEMSLRQNNPRPLIKGFYNINKSDVLFAKLKNKRTQRLDDFYIGEIVDVERDQQLALLVKSTHWDLSQLPEVKMITPEGKEKILQFTWVKSSLGESVKSVEQNDLVLVPYVNGVTVKTQVYLNPKT